MVLCAREPSRGLAVWQLAECIPHACATHQRQRALQPPARMRQADVGQQRSGRSVRRAQEGQRHKSATIHRRAQAGRQAHPGAEALASVYWAHACVLLLGDSRTDIHTLPIPLLVVS